MTGSAATTATAAAAAVGGWSAAERAARQSYGRLVALLAWRWGDLAAAEDALSEAFAAALARWPLDGTPASPEAWLMTVAQRHLLQGARRRRLADDPALRVLLEGDAAAGTAPAVPDARLKLLFVCAHPALSPAVHAPLMLQAVLGLDAARIASAFLVAPMAMAQRLVRAKSRIKQSGIGFDEPGADELPARLHAVLDGIYGAYTIGANTAAGHDGGSDLADEALFLARLVAALQPASAEAEALLALLLFCEARRPAQFSAEGRFVPLLQQDPAHWQRSLLAEGEAALWRAAALRQPGPLQLEAAIQSAHCQRAVTGSVPWSAVVHLYGLLLEHHPSTGAAIGHAAALGQAGLAADGLAALQALQAQQPAAVRSHQPFWVALAHLQRCCGDVAGAEIALQRAIGLTADPRIRAHLAAQQHGV